MSARFIYASILFVLILITLITTTAIENVQLSGLTANQEGGNVSFITGGATEIDVPVCQYNNTLVIPIVTDTTNGARCVGEHIGFLFSFAGLKSNFVWLSIIFTAIGVLMIYVAIRIIRGGG